MKIVGCMCDMGETKFHIREGNAHWYSPLYLIPRDWYKLMTNNTYGLLLQEPFEYVIECKTITCGNIIYMILDNIIYKAETKTSLNKFPSLEIYYIEKVCELSEYRDKEQDYIILDTISLL